MIGSLVNGRDAESLSILDRGLQFGDGLFETIAVVGGRPALWSRHLQRLALGCRRLGIPPPDETLLEKEARSLIGEHQLAVLKIIITRGCSRRGYKPPQEQAPTRILELFPWQGPDSAPRSFDLRICRQRLGDQPGYAGLKHLNRLEQVLAQRELAGGEGLMLDREGFVVSGTMSNLFLLMDDELLTPPIDRCGIAGVVRELVLDTARAAGRSVREQRIRRQALEGAQALFLTNSLMGIVPAASLEGRPLEIRHHPLLQKARERVFSADG